MDFGTRRVRGVRAARKRENINAHPSTAQTLKYYEKTRTPTLEDRYTGEESKVAMNSKETPEKMSNLEKVRGVRMQSQILRKQHSNTTGREHLNESHHDNDGDSCCDYEHLCFHLENEQVRYIRRCEPKKRTILVPFPEQRR